MIYLARSLRITWTRLRSWVLLALPAFLIAGFAAIVFHLTAAPAGPYQVAFLDQDQSRQSRAFIQDLQALSGIEASPVFSFEEGEKGVRKDRYDVLYTLPKGFGDALASGQRERLLQRFYELPGTSARLVSDSVSLLLVRQYTQADAWTRIHRILPSYPEQSYQAHRSKNLPSSALLQVKVHFRNPAASSWMPPAAGSRLFAWLWALWLPLLALIKASELFRGRLQGLYARLRLQGIASTAYYGAALLDFAFCSFLSLFFSYGLAKLLGISALPSAQALAGVWIFSGMGWALQALLASLVRRPQSFSLLSEIGCLLMMACSIAGLQVL